MELKTLLIQKRKAILDRWLAQILKTYPADAARFMGLQNDRFANPVGRIFQTETETIFDVLIGNAEAGAIDNSLEQINKIRAVQDFSASQAVAFIFFLKTAIREELASDLTEAGLIRQLLSLESQIDGLALNTFDSYMHCREKLFEVRCNDIRRQASLFGNQAKNRHKID
jgi:hypothetical protein